MGVTGKQREQREAGHNRLQQEATGTTGCNQRQREATDANGWQRGATGAFRSKANSNKTFPRPVGGNGRQCEAKDDNVRQRETTGEESHWSNHMGGNRKQNGKQTYFPCSDGGKKHTLNLMGGIGRQHKRQTYVP